MELLNVAKNKKINISGSVDFLFLAASNSCIQSREKCLSF